MSTDELVKAAAQIAGGMVATAFETGQLSPGTIQQVAHLSVALARQIEKEAQASASGASGSRWTLWPGAQR